MVTSDSDDRCLESEVQRPVYSSEVLPLAQVILAGLADLDLDYERERERICRATKDPNLRDRMLRKLEEEHRERRDPSVQRLRRLEDQIRPRRAGAL